MYAVIESGGKQYRVTVGDRLKVESLKLDPGSKLSLEKVLLVADEGDVKVGGPYLGSRVEATVIGHGRGKKVRIFKLRRRKNSRQQAGHRQNFTELEIISIDGKSGGKPKTAQPSEQKIAEKESSEEASVEKVAKEGAATKKTAKKITKKKTTKKKVTQKAEAQD